MKKINRPKFHALKQYLEDNDIKHDVAAELSGISKPTFSRKLNGRTAWDWDEMVLIKNGLKLDKKTFLNLFFNKEVTKM